MIQQFHFWVYKQKNRKQGPEEMLTYPYLQELINNSPEVKTTQVSIAAEQNGVPTYKRILFSLKNEGPADTCRV